MNKAPGKTNKVLLIGWDAADWEHINPLLEQGLLPNLDKFINEGVMGNLATLEPALSPMLWNSAVTGKYAFKHGIHGFVEPDHHHGGARPYSSYSRKCKALWNIFSQQGLKSNVINWWASHPAEPINGCVVTNLLNGVKFGKDGPIVSAGTVHPAAKASTYGNYKVLPQEVESEQICAFIPRAAEINQDEDSRLQIFANTLAETLTTHSAATAVMENEPWDFMAIYYTAIDHFSHAFMSYHPPRMSHISEKDFEIFKDVVTGAYRFSDMMLARLLQLAGEDTTVILCSDHGFHSGVTRPLGQPREPAGPAVWHRPYGIFVMRGPGVKRDERIYGASLIDIAPTILVAAGMPIGKDMDGRPLLEAFVETPEVETISSWDDVAGEFDSGMHQAEVPIQPEAAEDLLRQFVALGYVDDPGADKEKQFENAEIECQYNLSRSYMFATRYEEAIPLMEQLVWRSPWEDRFIQHLIHCYQQAGYLQQALNLIESAFEIRNTHSVSIQLSWIELQFALGRFDEETTKLLDLVENNPRTTPALLTRIAQFHAKCRNWAATERAYRKAIEAHPENAHAWQGLSRVYCRMGDDEKTINCALEAVSLLHRLPHAHLNLGIALARSGQPERAVVAFKTALQFSPGFVAAHRALSMVYRNRLNEPELARQHAQLWREHVGKHKETKPRGVERREQTFALPTFPTESERQAFLVEERPDRGDPRKPSGKTFTIVSGLPRSGTSLMMKMLEAGGLPPKTDGKRAADDDNPGGYYEWEDIKRIKTKPQILDEAGLEGKAIKAVSMILEDLPFAHNYKVIFMQRPIEEVIASQRTMIDHAKNGEAPPDAEELGKHLAGHRDFVRRKITANPRMEVMEIDYPTLVQNPSEMIALVAEFLGPGRLPHPEKMLPVVDPNLHRHKS